ncbi:MAG: calcium-binding protein, partial [Pseudomonas atacamensis]|uniref:calcium-binding protein n=1 Tax=Pseudomonas atacamensis TaxID=2565368 RepID=UPI0033150FB8
SYIDYTLGDNVENLWLQGSANLNGTGNALNNRLTGSDGNNVLNGMTGADTMLGMAGNDTYYVDNAGDVVIETSTSPSEIDEVRSSINYALGDNVENLTLLGDASIATGNALNNVLTGNEGADTLNGLAGADTMIGGTGNDTYYVDNVGDAVIETETSLTEIDRVLSYIDFTLGNNLENVWLQGTANLNGTGNSLDNRLTGNDGSNTLNGMTGADTMLGMGGNDTYYVDNVGDVVIETGTSLTEIDRVLSYIDYTLGDNVENLWLQGNENLNGTGNRLANVVTGNVGNNQLDGGAGNDILTGGTGIDSLTGGSGSDVFVFNFWNESGIGSQRDLINDFNSAQGDKIDLTKLDANLLTDGFDSFSFIGAADFTGAGQLRFVDNVLSGNVNGNAGADFEIQLVGVNQFSVSDLVA